MDQYLSAVIIAIISGVFGVIVAIIQKKQNNDIKKINQAAIRLNKEKKLKNELANAREDLEATINHVMILILDTNISVLKNLSTDEDKSINDALYEAEKLKDQFNQIMQQIKSINHDYQLLLDITQELEESSSSSDKHIK